MSIRTRVNLGVHWADARVVNISSRGMLLHCAGPLPIGAKVEIRQGEHAVSARVVWRQGQRSGLQCHSGIAISEWLAACEAPLSERREQRPRPSTRLSGAERSQVIARKLEFLAVMVIALAISGSVAALAATAILKPIAAIQAALGN